MDFISQISPGTSAPLNVDEDRDGLSVKLPSKMSLPPGKNKGGPKKPLQTSQRPVEIVPRFLVMKKKEGDFFRDSPFTIDRILVSHVGIVKSVKKIREGLLVETQSDTQSRKMLQLSSFNDAEVEVTPHSSLNYVKGVVTCRDLLNCTLEEITEQLSDQGVVGAKRMMTRRDGVLQETASLILTFERLSLPQKIKAGIYLSLPVRPYIPAPLRCFKCQKFGHTSARCQKEQICVCGLSLHEGEPCQEPVTCVNCNGTHSARSRNCPRFKEEAEIQRIKIIQKLSFTEAKRKVQENRISLPVSYAQAVRTTPTNLDAKTIVNEMIPEIRKICETLLQGSERSLYTRGFGSPFVQAPRSAITNLTATTTTAVKPHSSLPLQDKRKRSEALGRSASEISDADDESVLSSQTSQGEGGTKKRKPGWQKGRPRKPAATSQQDAGSDQKS